MQRDEALRLLESHHTFPSDHRFTVVVRGEDRERLCTLVTVHLDLDLNDRVEEVPSRNGTYVSLRLNLPMVSADAVLDFYAYLRRLDFLVTVM